MKAFVAVVAYLLTTMLQAAAKSKGWMTPLELAREQGIPLSSVYDLLKSGTGPAYYRLGKRIHIKRSDYLDWLAANRVDPVSAAR